MLTICCSELECKLARFRVQHLQTVRLQISQGQTGIQICQRQIQVHIYTGFGPNLDTAHRGPKLDRAQSEFRCSE